MKKQTLISLCIAALMSFTVSARAQDIIAELVDGCGPEIEKFCSGVTLGEGRLAACFYAYEDQLSDKCNYTLYVVSEQLQAAAIVLDYFVEQCGDDIDKFCPDVEPGEGRIVDCLATKSSALSQSCSAAIADLTK